MQTALKITTHILPGHRLEIVAPELAEGQPVEVFVVASEPAPAPKAEGRTSIWELIQTLPPGPHSASTWEEIERNLQEDRDAWDR